MKESIRASHDLRLFGKARQTRDRQARLHEGSRAPELSIMLLHGRGERQRQGGCATRSRNELAKGYTEGAWANDTECDDGTCTDEVR
jgi:hypothetical protein